MRYSLEDLLIDTEARAVHRGRVTITLPDLSFDVLVKLVETAPEPASLTELASTAWRAGYVSDETIAQRIALLRKALGDTPKAPVYIRTVRGAGYAIASPVRPVTTDTSFATPRFINRLYAIAAMAGMLALLVGFILFSQTRGADPKTATAFLEDNQLSSVAILVERARTQLGLHQARETERAISMLRDALRQAPDDFDGRLTLSFALSTKATKFGGDASAEKEAEALARALIDEQPDNSNTWSALAYALGSQGRIDESLHAYQYAYQLNPQNAPAISSAAYTQFLRGELHQALLLEARAKRVGGASRYAEIQIAQILELIEHPAAGKWHLRALSLNPSQVVILGEIARSHLRQGNPHGALEILDQAEDDDQYAPQILQLRGRALIKLGNFDKARLFLEAAGNDVLYDMAAFNAVTGYPDQAEELLLPANLSKLEADPSAETRVQYAEIAAALGQADMAMRFLAQAVNLGWRDTNWLKQSPFIGALMTSSEGLQIESRIAREIMAQRQLIEGTEDLAAMLDQ